MAKNKTQHRTYDARPDTLDFRDRMYIPTLYEVPMTISLDSYLELKVPILDQGSEGACTGFGLATVANYLLRRRKIVPDPTPVSPRMIYEMARRYDEWPGEDYSGSSARGAIKGWYKHGICADDCWPYKTRRNDPGFNTTRSSDATKRPLGAYFRVNHKDIVAMHSAISEVGILYATASVHSGWSNVKPDGKINYSEENIGGHAFAIVAYDVDGFWIQNSWGNDWGKKGFAHITYDDWLQNGTDVWVARLGAPVNLKQLASTAISHWSAAAESASYSYSDLRPHIISLGNDGQLKPGGDFGTSKSEVESIFNNDFPEITKNWKKKRLLLYAHGGLVSESAAVQRLADYRTTLLEAEVYPVSFIWHSDAWNTITNVLKDAFGKRKSEGILDSAKDFMLDRLDDALEPLARALTGKLQWDEMKENAQLATTSKDGGARLAAELIAGLAATYGDDFELHIIGHSAGSTFHARLIQLLTTKGTIASGPLKGTAGKGLTVNTCTLWAPACTIDLFKEAYVPAIKKKSIGAMSLFTLSDKAEQDDNCAFIYNKSLLYLVSNAFEDKARIPLFRDGKPILGMEKFIKKDKDLQTLIKNGDVELVLAPNSEPEGSRNHSTAKSHGDFDDDEATVKAALARMLEQKKTDAKVSFKRSASSMKAQRVRLVASQINL